MLTEIVNGQRSIVNGQLGVWDDAPVELRRDVALAGLTTMKVGGPADFFATVTTVRDLMATVRWARRVKLPYFVLGGGSNVLISDAGVRGLVIHNRCRAVHIETGRVDEAPCCDFEVRHLGEERPYLFAESGVALAGLARRSVRESLTGLEWAVSVPGTIGGATVGNAGAHGGAVHDNLADALLLDGSGDLQQWTVADFRYRYRRSALKESRFETPLRGGFGPVVLSANFRLARGDRGAIEARADQFLQHRRRTQPVEPSLGSTFENPPGDFAGRLIEAAGLKGARVGGASISETHANFIINAGAKAGNISPATAGDVMALIEQVQSTVQREFGVSLMPEVQRVGDWD